jgi:hypothetical protein
MTDRYRTADFVTSSENQSCESISFHAVQVGTDAILSRLEPLLSSTRQCLDHRHAYVRKNAVMAVASIFQHSEVCIPYVLF